MNRKLQTISRSVPLGVIGRSTKSRPTLLPLSSQSTLFPYPYSPALHMNAPPFGTDAIPQLLLTFPQMPEFECATECEPWRHSPEHGRTSSLEVLPQVNGMTQNLRARSFNVPWPFRGQFAILPSLSVQQCDAFRNVMTVLDKRRYPALWIERRKTHRTAGILLVPGE